MREIASNVYGCGRWTTVTTQKMKEKIMNPFPIQTIQKNMKHYHVGYVRSESRKKFFTFNNDEIIIARFTT